jgi:hypothetical protein
VIVACRRPGQGAGAAAGATVEIREASGFATFTLRATETGFVFVDHSTRKEGRIVVEAGGALRAASDGGRMVEARAVASGGLELRQGELVRLRLSPDGAGFRLADGREIPRGRLRADGAAVFAHGPGGEVTAQARSEGGRVTVVDRKGAAIGFVTGRVTPAQAAAVFLPAIDVVERALLLAAAW